MSDTVENPGATSAGRLLREAREAHGVRLEVLAHTLKVPPHKLEALEADRYEELPDTAFMRGLAQSICRSLQVDAAPVLALLPRASGHRLEQIGEGLNAPFRERPGHLDPVDGGIFARPAVWGPALLLLAASLVYWLPSGLLSSLQEQAAEVTQGTPIVLSADTAVAPVVAVPAGLPTISSSEPAAATANPDAPADTVASVETSAPDTVVGAAPAQAGAADAGHAANNAGLAAAQAQSLLQVQASKTSWVEVIDARGRSLLSRLVKPGETIALDGELPLKIRIGNAVDTRLVFRGEPLALAPYTRDNLAKLELR